jgi:flagellar motor switch protein FliG
MSATQPAGSDAAHFAALLLSSLDTHSAEKLRAGLSAQQLAALRRAERQLATLPSQERTRLLRSLRARLARPRGPQPPPGRPTRSVPALLRKPGQDTDRLPCVAPSAAPFAFLGSAAPEVVAELLESEPPALIALVAAHAPAPAGEAILLKLSADVRRAVALCIADLKAPAPGVLRCLSETLEEQVITATCATRERQRSAAATARALLVAGEDVAREALRALRSRRPPLADEVERQLALLASGPSSPRPGVRAAPRPATHANEAKPEVAAHLAALGLHAQPAV